MFIDYRILFCRAASVQYAGAIFSIARSHMTIGSYLYVCHNGGSSAYPFHMLKNAVNELKMASLCTYTPQLKGCNRFFSMVFGMQRTHRAIGDEDYLRIHKEPIA